jgi:hypothetical protein
MDSVTKGQYESPVKAEVTQKITRQLNGAYDQEADEHHLNIIDR